MSAAPMSPPSEPKDVASPGAHPAPRAHAAGPNPPLCGRLHPPALGRLGRGLVYGTGLFLLRPLLVLACRLVGWRRSATLRYAEGRLHLERELTVLGMRLSRESEHLPSSRLVSVSSLWTKAPEPLALGALCLGVAVLWGLWQVVDGIYGRSPALVGLGLGVLAAGVAADLLLYIVASRIPGLESQGIRVRTLDGREITVSGLAEADRDRFLASIHKDIE